MFVETDVAYRVQLCPSAHKRSEITWSLFERVFPNFEPKVPNDLLVAKKVATLGL